MENFPSNSHEAKKPKAEEPKSSKEKLEPIVKGGAVRRKKPMGRRFADMFFGGDIEGVVNYVIADVLLPAAKDAIADAFSQGIERMLFGESRPSNRRSSSRSTPSTYVSYNRYSSMAKPAREREREDTRVISRRGRSRHDFGEIILPSRAAAEEVLDRMEHLLDKYDHVTVANLYELVDIAPTFTDENWGWLSLRGARSRRVRSGYVLELPDPEEID